MTVWLMLVISIVCALSNNLLLHKFGNRGLRGNGDIMLFNALCSCVWIAVMGALGCIRGGFDFSFGAILWGTAYGVVIAGFLLSKMQAMATGPVSLTSFIGCSSLLISTAFGVFALGEGMSIIQGVGVIVLLLALYMVASPKNDGAKRGWLYWCLAFFVFSAATGIVFKLHQRSSYSAFINEMVLIAAVVSALIFFAAAIFLAKKQGLRMPRIPRSAMPFIIGCGVFGCCYNRLNVTLTGQLPGIVFFPLFNGAVILLSTLAGVILFSERLKRLQILGMLIGFAALLLTSGTVDGIINSITK